MSQSDAKAGGFRGRTPANIHSRFALTGAGTTAIPWRENARNTIVTGQTDLNQSLAVPPATAYTAATAAQGNESSDIFRAQFAGLGGPGAVNHPSSAHLVKRIREKQRLSQFSREERAFMARRNHTQI